MQTAVLEQPRDRGKKRRQSRKQCERQSSNNSGNRYKFVKFLFLLLERDRFWSKSSRVVSVIRTCMRRTAIGQSNPSRHLPLATKAGIVVKLGEGVNHLREGDRVGIAWLHSACGHCEFCLSGWETLCHAQQNSGYSVNGSFVEYALAPADYLARIPDQLSYVDAGPILCAGVTTYKGLKETEARPGEWVVISGLGGLGHVAIQYAKAMGLRVAAVDIGEDKLRLARQLGAELTVDAVAEDAAATIQKKLGGAHGVLVTAVSPPAFKQAIGMLRRRGTCVLVGLPPGGWSTRDLGRPGAG